MAGTDSERSTLGPSLDDASVVAATRAWLERAVIGLSLCPFAKAVHQKDQIRYVVSRATTVAALRRELALELRLLADSDPERIETSLLMLPVALASFLEFNEFLGVADAQIQALGLSGEIQIASFHPGYQFADSEPDAIENFTNRSPFPTLHLLREESVERAVQAFPDPASIYEKNMATLRALGDEGWRRVMAGGVAASEPPAGSKD